MINALYIYLNLTESCISKNNAAGIDKHSEVESYYLPKVPESFAQSITTENIIIEEIYQTAQHQNESNRKPDRIQTVHNDETSIGENSSIEIDRLSLANRSLCDQLQSVRNQLSDNLNRVREFEEQVKIIPKLQLELSVEKAENRDMHLKLKALETALQTKERNDEKVDAKETSSFITESTKSMLKEFNLMKPFSAQRVCATSLESLNIRLPPIPTEPQQSHKSVSCQLKIQPSTQNVSCMTTKIISRDVGVVTIPVHISTRTMGINTDISEKNPFEIELKKKIMKCASVQSDREPKIQTRNTSIQTDFEPIEKKSVGVLAVPDVKTFSCMMRPEIKSIGIDNIYQKPKVHSIGTDPIKQLIETISAKHSDSLISLKQLDNIQMNAVNLLPPETQSKIKELPKEFRSLGIQHSPNQSDKFSQFNEKSNQVLQQRTESTDTSDLIFCIHRGINTDPTKAKIDRHMNTICTLTNDKSTNTLMEQKSIKHSETNTDSQKIVTETTKIGEKSNEISQLNEHKCHNCLAKIEIKQRTIIKNPNKSQSPINAATTALATTSVDQTCIEKNLANYSQQSDLQTRIPRPTTLMSPRSEKKFTRQNTYTIQSAPVPTSPAPSEITSTAPCPAELYLS